MAKVHDFRSIGSANELVSEANSKKGPVELSDQVHLRLEYHSSVGFGQHEIGAGKNCNVRVLLQDRIVQTGDLVVEHLWLLTCAECYVVECLFRLFGFLVVVDYENLQSLKSQGCEESVYFVLGVVVVGGCAYSLDSTRDCDVQ